MFGIDTKEIKGFERDLKTSAKKAFPFATRNTLNQAAFFAQKTSKLHVRDEMITRNKWSVQSIQVDQARSLRISRQSSSVGSVAGYMADQEFGAVKVKTGKEGVSIATSYSSGEGENAQPRQKLPRKPNRLVNIRLRGNKRRSKNRKQRNTRVIHAAARTGRKMVFLDLGRRQGIFKVIGGKRRPKIKMIHDMSRQSVVIPKNPWLEPSVDKTQRAVPGMYLKALKFQVDRLRLFR